MNEGQKELIQRAVKLYDDVEWMCQNKDLDTKLNMLAGVFMALTRNRNEHKPTRELLSLASSIAMNGTSGHVYTIVEFLKSLLELEDE